jgi:CRISPR-associated protein Cst2
MNIFCTVLTYTAPSANYRGESAENRAVIQKITKGRFEYPIISPEAIRNALRETFATMGLPCNRKRLHDAEQLAVQFKDYPDADKFIDDFFMGWLVAAGSADRKKIAKELQERGRDPEKFIFKRDSILRMNLAVALEPYRHNSVFTQSPQDLTPKEIKGCKNTDNSQLLHREVTCTPFQYPFALNLKECAAQQEWTRKLLEAIGQLNSVAGNHARSYFEMAPASIVVRLTPQLAAGYDTYGFSINEQGKHDFREVIEGILEGDYPGKEFWLGGKLVKDMDEQLRGGLAAKGAQLERSPQKLLAAVGKTMFAGS